MLYGPNVMVHVVLRGVRILALAVVTCEGLFGGPRYYNWAIYANYHLSNSTRGLMWVITKIMKPVISTPYLQVV